MDTSMLFALLCFIASLRFSFSASGPADLESVPDLEKSMYTVVDGSPCVRLLNLHGEIGCSNPGNGKVVAPVVRLENANNIIRPSALLVSSDEYDSLLKRISNDSHFARNVAGVLVKSETQDMLKGLSPDTKFPQAEFSPYESRTYEWNPNGSGTMWRSYNFPVFLLSQSSSAMLQELAMKNEKRKKGSSTNVAEFDVVMQTTKAGTHDSESCLKEETCLPLGGYRAVFGRHFQQLIPHYPQSRSPLY